MLDFLNFNYENCPDIPEERLMRFKWMAKMRFVAAGSLCIIFTLLKLSGWVDFPYLPIVVISLIEMFVNQPYPFIVRRFKSFDAIVFLNQLVDVLVITWGVHSDDGLNTYYNLLLYPLVFIFTGIVFSRALTFILANLSWLCYAAMLYMEYNGIITHNEIYHMKMSGQDRFITMILVLPFYNIIAFFVSYLGTVLREREQQLKETKAMLVQANKLAAKKAQISASAEFSQRFSPSLMMMRGHIQKILERIQPDDPRSGKIRFLESEVTKMYETVNIPPPPERELTVAKQMVNVVRSIDQSVELLSSQLRKNNIEVHRQYDSEYNFVEGEPEQLQKVIFNLINYFRMNKSVVGIDTIWVETRNLKKDPSAQREIEIKLKVNELTLSSKEMDRIFDAAFAGKGSGKGTGLGMSIAYGIVQNHNGDIQAISEGNKGMSFLVTFPVSEEKTGQKYEGA